MAATAAADRDDRPASAPRQPPKELADTGVRRADAGSSRLHCRGRPGPNVIRKSNVATRLQTMVASSRAAAWRSHWRHRETRGAGASWAPEWSAACRRKLLSDG